ncbi:MAG: hypothetical protein ACI8RL_000991 [Cyclobacteriaceae bacterium]
MSLTLIFTWCFERTNIRSILRIFIFVFLVLFALSLRSQDNVVGQNYHNVTAHYNGYWIAKERILEIERTIEQKYAWDYNKMLPVFAQFDTTTSRSLETTLIDCIEKASIAIQRHPESKWEDDAYILVGMARLYGSEFPEAIETFKYVNTNGNQENDKNRALVFLMRTFIEAQEMENALAVLDYLSKRKLNDQDKARFSLVKAYYFQKLGQNQKLASYLDQALLLLKHDPDYARLSFVLGQAYQAIGQDSASYVHYKQAIKSSKTYELSFYARLNMSQVSQGGEQAGKKEVRRYFKKLLNDPKNEDYKGRILYEIGNFDYKNESLNAALTSYKESASVNKNDSRLRSYTFLKIADIYYYDLKGFSDAKSYYDSTIQILPREEPGYEELVRKGEILTEFVSYYETIQLNDSLLVLAELPRDSLSNWLDSLITEMELMATEMAEQAAKEKRRSAFITTSNTQNESQGVDIQATTTGTWYFYNSAETSKGFSEFRNKWGSRALEDNWRRSLKTGASDLADNQTTDQPAAATENIEVLPEESLFDAVAEKERLLSTIPLTANQQEGLNAEVEEAMYQVGKIYNFKLLEKGNANDTFVAFLARFDSSRYVPEVLYQLYLLQKPLDSSLSMTYFTQLVTRHDSSIYAKLAINPNYLNERDRSIEEYKKIYVRAFDLYDDAKYKQSQSLIDSALYSHPANEYVDNLHLLKAMNYGEIEGIYKYQFELNNFITDFSESDLLPYAEKLLKTSQDFQINLYSSSRAKYIKNFETDYYFILVYPFADNLTDDLTAAMKKYIRSTETSLSTGSVVLDENNALILVSEFLDKTSSVAFLKKFNTNNEIIVAYPSKKITPLIITKENFQIFYETKDLEGYLSFFKRNY